VLSVFALGLMGNQIARAIARTNFDELTVAALINGGLQDATARARLETIENKVCGRPELR
jgi:hypothetical protein